MKKKISKLSAIFIAVSMMAGMMGCSSQESDLGLNGEAKEASQYTIDRNNEVYALLDFDDKDEFENATRGLITAPETLDIKDENGKVVWSQTAYSFIDTDSRIVRTRGLGEIRSLIISMVYLRWLMGFIRYVDTICQISHLLKGKQDGLLWILLCPWSVQKLLISL